MLQVVAEGRFEACQDMYAERPESWRPVSIEDVYAALGRMYRDAGAVVADMIRHGRMASTYHGNYRYVRPQ